MFFLCLIPLQKKKIYQYPMAATDDGYYKSGVLLDLGYTKVLAMDLASVIR